MGKSKTPAIGPRRRCWVKAMYVRAAKPEVDIEALYGAGEGGAKMLGTVIRASGKVRRV